MIPLKNKTGTEVAGALQKVFKERKPEKLWVDKGKEFYNEPVNYWSRCSTWRPFAFTHARSRDVHWSTASSTTHCRMLAHCVNEALLQVDSVTDRRLVQTLLHQAPNAVIDWV